MKPFFQPEDTDAQTAMDYVRGMERLLDTVQELSLARDLPTVMRIVRSVARELTGCDGATFVLNDGDSHCYYADEDAIAPLWKGLRFPQEQCISGWVMRNATSVVIPDVFADPRIPADAYRPTFVKSMVMVPIRTIQPVGAIGNYWAKEYTPRPTEIRLLQALADATSVAMENVTFYADLEDRVRLRTQQLTQAQQVLQRSAVTDELTGLLNRRGFYQRAEALLESDQPALLAYIDADGLKAVNDRLGHAAGDAMLVGIADSLKSCFRADDVVARMGGDEFCVLMLSPQYDVTTLQQQLEERIARVNAVARNGVELAISIGCVAAPVARAMPLDDWLRQADARMYQDKQSRRSARA